MVVKLSEEDAGRVAALLNYRHDGLVVAVAQDARTAEVLMVAFMDAPSLIKTLTTGMAHYFSKSRRRIWLKGERSGHFQYVEEALIDCDNDALLLKVRQVGGACHLGYRSCFFRRLIGAQFRPIEEARSKLPYKNSGVYGR
ncbi:TPA: phosphoribosyl-AMP cyclohydrolase [Candidatus Bathyarchaeota archaeon]|nr:phosphoribosyl-AMP cyclohydrolase [Candidatus Bathyarchaeota archaeon]